MGFKGVVKMKEINNLKAQKEELKLKLKTTTNYEERRELERKIGLLSSKISFLKNKKEITTPLTKK